MRNFFFFFDGDLFGDSSLPWSPAASSAATGSSPSTWAGAGSGSEGAGSSAGRAEAAASEDSSGVRSGRVCLKVAASLSSLGVWSCCRSERDGKTEDGEGRVKGGGGGGGGQKRKELEEG